MDKLRFGLAGIGGIVTEFHLPVLRANLRVEVVAACGSSAESTERFAKQHGIPAAHADFRQMAADPNIDAVLISTPNSLHAPMTHALLAAGKHVLCEKPMALTAAEAQTMIAAAQAADRRLAIAHPWRCDVDFQWLRDTVHCGRLGKIFKTKGHAVITGDPPGLDNWRCNPKLSGGGALMDLGVHVIDTISYLFDDQLSPVLITARAGNNFAKAPVEDTATVLIEYADGMLALIDVGWHHNFQNSVHGAVEVFGTEGYARTFPTELYSREHRSWTSSRPPLHATRPHIDASMYAAQIESFLDYVQLGSSPVCDARQGYRNMVMLDAIYQSARTGEAVAIHLD